ncbi:HD-GYP domain-containing protein [Achromobacter sp. DH1f]|uniref:HD-GYP domain-containing protein n=1 Tax=Achromobacter sp. DH1f TaxID=1397275 RepID=UPI0005B4FEBA|nr:HD-GYP domain-containing protein [Achromobacter sp. DH1f]
MLKRINKKHLVLGMHIHELCGTWLEHPFWKSDFLLESQEDLTQILKSSVQQCWIDNSRGLDIQEAAVSISDEQALVEAQDLFEKLYPPRAEIEKNSCAEENRVDYLEIIDIQSELARAASICSDSKEKIMAMFDESRLGKSAKIFEAEGLVFEISESIKRNPGALISLARIKSTDEYTYMHSVAVCALMISLARELNFNHEDVQIAGLAGLLHDIGKVSVPLSILNKSGKLSAEEFDIIRGHPIAGFNILKEWKNMPQKVLDACLHHHEKIDGSGYPYRLIGNEITQISKMTAICDVYDAITSDRPYKKGWDPSEALHRMACWGPGHFDMEIFHAFVKSIGIYPIGSLVRLTSGSICVVCEQVPRSLKTPIVKLIYCTKYGKKLNPDIINLSQPECMESIVSRVSTAEWEEILKT